MSLLLQWFLGVETLKYQHLWPPSKLQKSQCKDLLCSAIYKFHITRCLLFDDMMDILQQIQQYSCLFLWLAISCLSFLLSALCLVHILHPHSKHSSQIHPCYRRPSPQSARHGRRHWSRLKWRRRGRGWAGAKRWGGQRSGWWRAWDGDRGMRGGGPTGAASGWYGPAWLFGTAGAACARSGSRWSWRRRRMRTRTRRKARWWCRTSARGGSPWPLIGSICSLESSCRLAATVFLLVAWGGR